jgi:hypothetical protein
VAVTFAQQFGAVVTEFGCTPIRINEAR